MFVYVTVFFPTLRWLLLIRSGSTKLSNKVLNLFHIREKAKMFSSWLLDDKFLLKTVFFFFKSINLSWSQI